MRRTRLVAVGCLRAVASAGAVCEASRAPAGRRHSCQRRAQAACRRCRCRLQWETRRLATVSSALTGRAGHSGGQHGCVQCSAWLLRTALLAHVGNLQRWYCRSGGAIWLLGWTARRQWNGRQRTRVAWTCTGGREGRGEHRRRTRPFVARQLPLMGGWSLWARRPVTVNLGG